MNALRPLTCLALAALPATTALALPVLTGGTETNAAGYAENFTTGYDFVSTTNQFLTALGMWDSAADGVAGAFQVGLWATATQTLLATATIDNADVLDGSVTVAGGQWRYETLGAPVALSSGTTYTLGWHSGPVTAPPVDALFLDYSTATAAPTVATINQSRFFEGGALAFPSATTSASTQYFTMANAQLVPEPGSALLSSAGALGLALRRRRAQG